MKVWLTDAMAPYRAMAQANADWANNLKFNRCDIHKGKRGFTATITITVLDSSGKGGKRSFSMGRERKVHAACWHAYRDFIAALFDHGATRVQTMMADYKSREDFDAKFPATGYTNVGSMMYPVQAHETCECGS